MARRRPRKIDWEVSFGKLRGVYNARTVGGAVSKFRRDPEQQARHGCKQNKGGKERQLTLTTERGGTWKNVSVVPAKTRTFRYAA